MSTVRYTVRFPEPHTHYVEVEALIPTEQPAVELFMAVWTPGSYLVREYARHVERVAAAAGTVARTTKNRWRAETGGASEIRLTYRVYCREMSVRTNWVEESFALLNGAPTFIAPVELAGVDFEVTVELPAGWKASYTGLEGENHRYYAADYDTLVDSPIVAGNPSAHRFEVDGIPHWLVNVNEDGVWDAALALADTERIVRQYRAMWGSLPYRKYVFLNLLTESGGGLEHANSMVIMGSRWATRTRRAYLGWLTLVSHEFLHVWNVKRLRPAELGPFDYERENPTRSLWIAEGITHYYEALTVHRAGLSSREEYLGEAGLSGLIQALQSTPGRLVSSVEQASFDAWIKLYRPDENTVNTSISYYTKGAVAAWLLDARVRRATGGAKSLDDAMLLAFARYSGARGFTTEEFKALAEEVAGEDLREFFRQTTETAGELDYSEALDWFGLRFRPAGSPDKAWTGAETKVDGGRLVVTKTPRGTPAHAAGINVDDEIVGIDGFRVRAEQWAQRLENYQPGDEVSVLVARREKLMRIGLRLSAEPAKRWLLEVRPDSMSGPLSHLTAWLA